MADDRKTTRTRARANDGPTAVIDAADAVNARDAAEAELEQLDEGAELEAPEIADTERAAAAPRRPPLTQVSGLYEWTSRLAEPPVAPSIPPRPSMQNGADGLHGDGMDAASAVPLVVTLRETLRLDVDGRFPQLVVSGTIYRFLVERVHWIARLRQAADGSWSGPIWYRDGATASFPYQQVHVSAQRSPFPTARSATVTFSGGTTAPLTRTYKWSSSYFHPCEMEYDVVEGATAVTSIRTHDHPTRPPSLPAETLSIETVYRRAGFNVTRGADNPIPITPNTASGWNAAEMHDAMQVFWSRFADRPQWAVWTLYASLSEEGTSLGGVMFDDIGPRQRQGTAVFSESFIKDAPNGDAAPAAWVKRMRFWTAVHELGHTFNLAHSWQKVHPPSWGSSWVPLVNEPEARSFMNYPYNVSGGQAAFFASFEFRFSDQELLFMRHAPERFVQQGNAAWFSNHGFEQLRVGQTPAFALELRSNQGADEKSTAVTQRFLDQVVVELKLTNVTDQPRLVDEKVLETLDRLTVVVKRAGGEARIYEPHATMCWHARKQVLEPGKSVYAALYLSAGRDGFYVDAPGRYVVQAALHLEDEDIVSNPFHLRILPPRGYDEEEFAQDLFVGDVGRVLRFDGTRALDGANAVLRDAVALFPDHPIATHARVALGLPRVREFKELAADDGKKQLRFDVIQPDMGEARQLLQQALSDDPARSARTLGHKDFADYGKAFARALDASGDEMGAEAERQTVVDGLRDRGVRKEILASVEAELHSSK